MPLYVIERSIPEGLGLAPTQQGRQAATTVIGNNTQLGVTWLHSYVTPDLLHLRQPDTLGDPQGGRAQPLPVERITEVRVLDPYFHM